MNYELNNGQISGAGGVILLSELAETFVSLLPDSLGCGVFLRFTADKPAARHVFTAGTPEGAARWTACHRYEPFWMEAKAGTDPGAVPVETQSLLFERTDGTFALLVPLIGPTLRCALEGDGAGGLRLVAESGNPAVVASEVVGLFVASGDDPFRLVEEGARSVAAYLGTGRLRRDKAVPSFVDQFGWCTWDSFYKEVNAENVRLGLQSFRDGGVEPRLLILDDGWQSVGEKTATGEERLTAFAANAKFPGGLRTTVDLAKNEFGIETFLVWHAFHGYWGGVDGEKLPGYGVRSVARDYSAGIKHYYPDGIPWFGNAVGLVAPEHSYRFFHDYHRSLREQGVDGVKVDNQAATEGVARGSDGGRIALMKAYREALEGSVQTHFGGNLINCMSCANEMLYQALASTVTRTSTDFWPKKPESHGLHLYVNAQVSLWFGEWVLPDWDMFQSGHEMGSYHAAGRAISGGPVYVSDKPDAHDFDLLRQLVLPDGTTLRCDSPGRPTRDCLFHDPTRENVLLKIWNTNGDGARGVVGAFHARYDESGGKPISGAVRPSDAEEVEGPEGERFAVWAHQRKELRLLARDEAWEFTLDPLTWELFTIAPVLDDCAAVTVADLLNGGAALTELTRMGDAAWVDVAHGHELIVWSAREPETCAGFVGDTSVDLEYTYDAATGLLRITLPSRDGEMRVGLAWEDGGA
jgi:raffinose synthase